MLFNSYIFLFAFLPITWIAFRVLSNFKLPKIAIGILVLASLVFYSYWNPPFVLLILFSIVFNFIWGSFIAKSQEKSNWKLWVGIGVNIVLIAYFKYFGFFLQNINMLFGANLAIPKIFLPLGISFFTFQQIAYLIDCHRGVTKEQSFLHYCLFVTFFPQLIAGPIVHHGEMMSQFADKKTFIFSSKQMSLGFSIFAMGLFKKIVIADTLSPWVAQAFDGNTGNATMLIASWIGSLAYTLQIYFDFSGYTDMALGLGHFFNIKLPVNFDAPYKSRSIVEFWRRWHITLSRFLRDYLYIPLGGNRKGSIRRYVNLLITMLIGGLWHGASWTFVFWGGLHGFYLCINNVWETVQKKTQIKLPLPVAWALTFPSIVFAWVFFRATTFDSAINIVKGMIGLNGIEDINTFVFSEKNNELLTVFPFNERIALLIVLLSACLVLPVSWRFAREKMERFPFITAVFCALIFATSIMGLNRISEFLYFQF